MKYFTKENIILALIAFVFIQGLLNTTSYDDGLVEYQSTIIKLTNEKIHLMDSINGYEIKINDFKHEKNKIDSITSDYSVNQLDSFFTDFFK